VCLKSGNRKRIWCLRSGNRKRKESSKVVTGKELCVSEVVTEKELCVSDLVIRKESGSQCSVGLRMPSPAGRNLWLLGKAYHVPGQTWLLFPFPVTRSETPDSFPFTTFQTHTILTILGKTLISSYLFRFKGKEAWHIDQWT
jgi:hypothetical protein